MTNQQDSRMGQILPQRRYRPSLKPSALVPDLWDLFAYALLLLLLYCVLYLAIGDPFAYGGPAWSTVFIWATAHIGGILFGLIRLPPLLGMLLSGLLFRNALPSSVAGLPRGWSEGFRGAALGTIFLRSGLELDLKVFRRVGPAAVRLLLIPGLVEAFLTGTLAFLIFPMPPMFGYTLGFILKAVGPAVVIQTMFDIQKMGLAVAKGVPSIVVAAASFDDMVAITGYSLFSSLAIPTNGSRVWSLLHGVMDIGFGLAGGLLGAAFCSFTALWSNRWRRCTVVLATALALLFFLYSFHFKGGGALATLVLGLFTNVFWERGIHFFGVPGLLATGPSSHYAHEVEVVVGVLWRAVAQPLLFGIIGTLVNLRAVAPAFIPRSLAVIFAGLALRMPTTYLAMTGARLNWKERLFVAIAWTPKATVQAALGAQPLDRIIADFGPHAPEVIYGREILTTSVFAILICATCGVLAIHHLAPILLEKVTTGRAADDVSERDGGPHAVVPPRTPPGRSASVPALPVGRPSPAASAARPPMYHPLVGYLMGTESGQPLPPEYWQQQQQRRAAGHRRRRRHSGGAAGGGGRSGGGGSSTKTPGSYPAATTAAAELGGDEGYDDLRPDNAGGPARQQRRVQFASVRAPAQQPQASSSSSSSSFSSPRNSTTNSSALSSPTAVDTDGRLLSPFANGAGTSISPNFGHPGAGGLLQRHRSGGQSRSAPTSPHVGAQPPRPSVQLASIFGPPGARGGEIQPEPSTAAAAAADGPLLSERLRSAMRESIARGAIVPLAVADAQSGGLADGGAAVSVPASRGGAREIMLGASQRDMQAELQHADPAAAACLATLDALADSAEARGGDGVELAERLRGVTGSLRSKLLQDATGGLEEGELETARSFFRCVEPLQGDAACIEGGSLPHQIDAALQELQIHIHKGT